MTTETTQYQLAEMARRRRAVEEIRDELRGLLGHVDPVERAGARIWIRKLGALAVFLAERERQAAAYQRRWH
jgi:hypothetical protein